MRSSGFPLCLSLGNRWCRSGEHDTPPLKISLARHFLLVGKWVHIAVPAKPVGELTLFFDDKMMADLWIAVQWSSK